MTLYSWVRNFWKRETAKGPRSVKINNQDVSVEPRPNPLTVDPALLRDPNDDVVLVDLPDGRQAIVPKYKIEVFVGKDYATVEAREVKPEVRP